MSEDTEIDTGNYQGVAMNGAGWIVVLLPLHQMTRQQALVHAAWIVALCAPEHNEFERVLTAVMGT